MRTSTRAFDWRSQTHRPGPATSLTDDGRVVSMISTFGSPKALVIRAVT